MKQPMKSRDVLPKNVPGVGWVGCVIQGWGGVGLVGVGWVMVGESYTEQLGYRGQPSLSAHFTTLAITWNYWGSKIQLQPCT